MKIGEIAPSHLLSGLLNLAGNRRVSILDSCGVGHQGANLLIAGLDPVDVVEFGNDDPSITLSRVEQVLDRGLSAIFTVSYDFGAKLQGITSRHSPKLLEPDIQIALFDSLIVYDYENEKSFVCGDQTRFRNVEFDNDVMLAEANQPSNSNPLYLSNVTETAYKDAVEQIREFIRCGDTYQVNLTQQLSVILNAGLHPRDVFIRLRNDHPAPFAAYLDRGDSIVVSASPERFFTITGKSLTASPIKGTGPRGSNFAEDERFRIELLNSEKDRAENTMIVDLLRNDLGRVCEYGSVEVKNLCQLEKHPTLFHLVSTIEGKLRDNLRFAEILRALFPCGSITGAPKIRTMRIIDELEPSLRGLSMGAIGYFIPETGFDGTKPGFDLSVAIRTIVIRDGVAVFNVGGGVTIDSNAQAEFDESLLKAKALLAALGNK